jgi:23S rRNA (cytosine1962-C5)-methyltransferase
LATEIVSGTKRKLILKKRKMYSQILLKRGREQAVKRFHPWVFSGAIAKINGQVIDGALVQVLDYQNNILAVGHYYSGSIAVKICGFGLDQLPENFYQSKLANALVLRKKVVPKHTNAYRLIHGEGDGLPGLIIDIYANVAVFQAHSIGMYEARQAIVAALLQVFDGGLVAVYDKSAETLPKQYAANQNNGYLFGQADVPLQITENGIKFNIDWITGQKTGFFLDQRDNRKLLQTFVNGKSVLNAFCYSGGFSAYALQAGASVVYSVDSSAKAIQLAENNIAANGNFAGQNECVVSDVMEYLKNSTEFYDVIILDPPAYAKSMDARHRALQAYKRLNIIGLARLKPGGMLFTFSCSQVVERQLFYDTIVAAGIEAGRAIRVLHHLSQGADHPVNFYHPEGHYLKGLALYVD